MERKQLEQVAELLENSMLRRYYLKGGGSSRDFVTDLGDVVEAILEVRDTRPVNESVCIQHPPTMLGVQ